MRGVFTVVSLLGSEKIFQAQAMHSGAAWLCSYTELTENEIVFVTLRYTEL
jgi:hypothetical protein